MRKPLEADMFPECAPGRPPFRIGGKWVPKIIRCLESGPRRFSELQVPLRGITPKVLTESLRSMERDGLLARTVLAEGGDGRPEPFGGTRAVEYELTALGRSLIGPMDACCSWSAEHLPEVIGARESYDEDRQLVVDDARSSTYG